jgi:polyisoprenyl-teichoic acid--peptidoglycan teichoic acid transferase
MNRRRKGIDGGLVVLLLIAVVVVAATVFLVIQLRTDAVAEVIREGRPFSLVFLVSDDDGELLCTEVLLYHPITGKAALFDIPGEWGTILEKSDRMDRIDRLYRFDAASDYLDTVSRLLDLPIDWRFEMSLTDVERVVDLIDGLGLFIANPVELLEPEKMILLPSGSLVLDGSKVVDYLSYDDPDEVDIERRGRYQKFVQSFLKAIGDRRNYLLSDSVFGLFEKSVGSNLGPAGLRSLVLEIGKLKADYIVPKHVHGDRVRVDEQILLFPHFDGNLIRESVRQTLDSLSNLEVVGADELTILIQVLNGTSQNGLGARTAQLFNDFGYDVLPASNAEQNDYEKTIVMSNTGDLSKAQQVANLIRCTNVVIRELDEMSAVESFNEQADVTIILGKDFDGRYCKE